MRILRMEVWHHEMPLRTPYAIAFQAVTRATNIFVRVVTDSRLVGYGCAAPEPDITGDSPDEVQAALEGGCDELTGQDPLRIAWLMERLSGPLANLPSARAAIDMALHDLLGKVANLPLWKLLGGYRECIATSITIGIMEAEPTVAAAREYAAQGFKALKLKGGLDAREDAERVQAVRRAVGPNVQIRFDANQGYTMADAIEFFEGTRTAGVELLEQPTPQGQPDLLGRVTRAVRIPVMADESLMSLRDAFRLAQAGLMDMANVKLMKVGGLSEALQVNAVARSAGLEVMVGCMDESALAIAAGLHFSLARPNVVYADLDGHIDLLDDPFASSVILTNGVLYPTHHPGLGWSEG